MSSSPSSSLALDFFGLSLVDTPPSNTKIHTKNIAVKKVSRRIDDDEKLFVNPPDNQYDHLTIIDDSSCHTSARSSVDSSFSSQSESCQKENDDSSFTTEESSDHDPDPVWILKSKVDGYTLNDSSASYATFGSTKWPPISLPKALYRTLYPHQKIGVRWLASLHNRRETDHVGGGVLGDDMGLGKTMQTLAFISGLFRSQTIRNALVICPTVIVQAWKTEAYKVFNLCGLSSVASIIVVDSSSNKNLREEMLRSAMICGPANPCLVITTYGIVKEKENLDFFLSDNNVNPKGYWNYVILDEGQCIKNNNTRVHISVRSIASNPNTRRLLLTGTPIQNNLNELWSIFDWVTGGKLLGHQRTFLNEYAKPIENGRNKDASEWTLNTAEKANKKLQLVLQPHLLQRLKAVELKDVLTKKKELVVWIHLSESQRKLYEEFLVDSGKMTALFTGEMRSPLQAITWLKKLCAHPCLVNSQLAESCTKRSHYIEHSAKLQVLLDLVLRLHKSGHRFLIFSQSTKMLDIIEKIVPLSLARIDGSTQNRQRIVDSFNTVDSSFDGMLLSTKAAGIGLTLTAADRAIIYDPSWNPSDDAQATDRLYRIGQNQNVTIYRFITAGTVEERMYEKQIQKDGISRTVLTESNVARIFSREDWTNLFKLMPAGECRMIKRLRHKGQAVVGGSGKISILADHPKVLGITSHDVVFDKNLDFIPTNDSSVDDRSTRASSNDQNATIDVRKSTALLEIKENQLEQHKENPIQPHKENQIETHKENQLETLLFKVDTLTQSGDIDESLSLLLDATALDVCKGHTRLMIHKQIAARASHLGFLRP